MGCAEARACRKGKVSAGAGDREVLWEGRALAGAGRHLVPGRVGSAQPLDEFDLYSEGNGKF